MKKLLVATILSLFSTTLWAADGSSGCGPGWYLFKKNSLVSSALRATTNGILIPVTTLGMTFGTSRCTRHSLVKTEHESLKYATENYYELLADAAKGSGEFLSGYAATIGCKAQDIKTFGQELQRHLPALYKTKGQVNPEEFLKETYRTIFQNNTLLYSCSLS